MPNAYELEREARIAANRKKMEELGLAQAANALHHAVKTPASGAGARGQVVNIVRKVRTAALTRRRVVTIRRSARIRGGEVGSGPDYVQMEGGYAGDDANLLDLMAGAGTSTEAGAEPGAEPAAAAEQGEAGAVAEAGEAGATAEQTMVVEVRVGRGRKQLDPVYGISCHYCRQKALCEEVGCPRCTSRDLSKQCIGKSQCSRCLGARGIHCRACLFNRYGLDLSEAQQPDWICPHCYEEEHPDDGWFCNASNCMRSRGCLPTGIAAPEAQGRGFKSVAHLLQHRVQARRAAGLPVTGNVEVVADGDEQEEEEEEEQGAEEGKTQPQQQAKRRPKPAAKPRQQPAKPAQAKPRKTAPAAAAAAATIATPSDSPVVKRGRGRPRKVPLPDQPAATPADGAAAAAASPVVVKRGRGRPPKKRAAVGSAVLISPKGKHASASKAQPAAGSGSGVAPAPLTGTGTRAAQHDSPAAPVAKKRGRPPKAKNVLQLQQLPSGAVAGGQPGMQRAAAAVAPQPLPAVAVWQQTVSRGQRVVRPTAKAMEMWEVGQAKAAQAAVRKAVGGKKRAAPQQQEAVVGGGLAPNEPAPVVEELPLQQEAAVVVVGSHLQQEAVEVLGSHLQQEAVAASPRQQQQQVVVGSPRPNKRPRTSQPQDA